MSETTSGGPLAPGVSGGSRMDGHERDLSVLAGCDWDTEHDGFCPVDPCQCRPSSDAYAYNHIIPAHIIPARTTPASHTPDSARFPIGQRMGCEHGALGHDGKMRRIGPRRSALWLLRHLSAVVARLQRGSVLTNCWGSDVGRAGVDRDGDRGSSTGRGEL